MTCSICNLKGHNMRTCKNINSIQRVDTCSTNHNTKNDNIKCVICFNISTYTTTTPCKHTFCSTCIFTNITYGNFNCPLCRKVLVNPRGFFNKKHRRQIKRLKEDKLLLRKHVHTLLKQLKAFETTSNTICPVAII